MRAYEAGWGGVVTKTIGLRPVINVVRAGAKFMRTSPEDSRVSMKKRLGAALHSSWNRELLSDKPLDWWLPRIRRIKQVFAATGWSRSRRSGGPMPPTIAPATSRPRATLAPRLSGR